MRLQKNKGVELKRLSSIRILSLPSATLLAFTISISPPLLAETPIVIGPLPIEAVTSWIGPPYGGSWGLAANWNTRSVPGQGQGSNRENVDLLDFDTIIPTGRLFRINSLTGSGRLIADSSIELAADSYLGALTQRASTIFGSGNLTVSGEAWLDRVRQTGSGTTFLQGNTTVTGTNLDTVGHQGGLNLDNGRTVVNQGHLTWLSGFIDLNRSGTHLAGSGRLENADGAEFITSGADAVMIHASDRNVQGDDGRDASFSNAGTFRKTASTADHVTTIGVNFVNTGTVSVETGILSFTRSGDFRGVFELTEAAELRLSEGQYALNGGEVLGAGYLRITGDSPKLVNSDIDPGAVNANPPTVLNVNNDYRIANLRFDNGIIDLSGGSLTVDHFNQQPVSHVRGSHDLIVTADALLNGGTHYGDGRTILKGNSQITADTLYLDGGRKLLNEGQFTLSGGLINLNGHDGNSRNSVIAGGASLINAADASFIFSGNAGSAIMVSSGTDLAGVNQTHFNNQGKLRKTASSYGNESDIAVAFTNFGLVDVETGILSFSQAFTNHGRIQVHASTQLVIASRFDLLNEIDGHLSGDSSVVLFKNNEFRAQLINQGHVNPGIDDIGHLTVLGDYVQTDTGRLQIELAGLDAFDTLDVQGWWIWAVRCKSTV